MTASVALDVAGYRALLGEVFDEQVVAWTAEAEATERFPRKLIEYLGASGVFTGKWGDQIQPDVGKLLELAYQLGHLGSAGIGVGVSLHDSAIAILRRFGRSDYLKAIADAATRGEAVLCIGASEESGGSDLQICETEVRSARGGFEVRGIKKFVSLSPISDHIMVVARSVDHDPNSRHGSVLVIAVPTVPGRRADRLPQGGSGTAGHRRRAHRHVGACRRVGRAGGYRPGRHLLGPGP